jgi:WD40 repeat protein
LLLPAVGLAAALALLSGCRARSAPAGGPLAEVSGGVPAAAADVPADGPAGTTADPLRAEPEPIGEVRLVPRDVPRGFRGDRIAAAGADDWLAVGYGELLRATEGRLERRPLPMTSGRERLVLAPPGGGGRPVVVRIGSLVAPLDPAAEVRQLLEEPSAPPCGGFVTNAAVATPDGRRLLVLRSEAPPGCLLPDGSHPPSHPLVHELLLLDGTTGALLGRRDVETLVSADLSSAGVVLRSHDGLQILSAGALEPVARRPLPVGGFVWPRFSPGGEVLAATGSEGRVALFETTEWAVALRWDVAPNTGVVAFHPHRPLFALAATDGTVQLWVLEESLPRLACSTPPAPTPFAGIPTDLAFSLDGAVLVAARGPGTDAAAWTVELEGAAAEGGRPWSTIARFVRRDSRGRPLPPEATARLGDPGIGDGERLGDLVFDGEVLRVLDRRGRVGVWPDRAPRGGDPDAPEYDRLALAPDGSFLARAARESTVVEVVVPADGRVRARIDLGQYVQTLRVGSGWVAAGAYGVAGLWTPDGVERRLHRHPTTVTAVDVSADGHVFASCDIDGLDLVSRLDSEAAPRRMRDEAYARDAQLSPDGTRLYVVHYRSTLRIWDTTSGRRVRSVETGREPQDRLAVTADGRYAAVGGHAVVLVDLEDGSTSGQPLELGSDILRFDPAGRRLLTASRYGAAQLWEVPGLRALPSAAAHTAALLELRVAADGAAVYALDGDGAVFRWTVATEAGEFLGYGSSPLLDERSGSSRTDVTEDELRRFSLDGAVARAAAPFPDGERWAVGYDDRTILVLDAAARRPAP